MPPDQDLVTLATRLRSLAETAAQPKTWFARITRSWSPERQVAEQTVLAAILTLAAEIERGSAAQGELSQRQAEELARESATQRELLQRQAEEFARESATQRELLQRQAEEYARESATQRELSQRHAEELARESAARQELMNRQIISEGKARALFASLQAVATSTEDVGKEVGTFKTEIARELSELGRRLSEARADVRTIENSSSIQTGKLVETRHELDRALEQFVAIRTSLLEQTGRIEAMQTGLVNQFGQVARDLQENRADWKEQIERIDAALSDLTARTNATVVSLMTSITSAREATSHEAEMIKERITIDRQESEARSGQQDAELTRLRAEYSARLGEAEAELARVAEYARSVRSQLTSLAAEVRRPAEALQHSAPSAHAPSDGSRGEHLPQLNARLAGIESATATLRGALAGLADTSLRNEAQAIQQNRQQSLFERFYVAFENKYRGSMAEIRTRQQKLVPFVERSGALQTIPRHEAVIIDLGCGRGEWLELLRATGFERALGIDTNVEMLNECRKRSLTVEQADALTFLGRQPDKSVVAITGFHIVEHLPFPMVLDLMNEARRVLAKTGVLIFETPNPENALVATRTFHLDPSHRAPMPPQLLAFAMEHVGFSDVQILRLHPYPAKNLVKENSAVAKRFNDFFFGAQDYAVVGNNA